MLGFYIRYELLEIIYAGAPVGLF